MYPKHTCFQAAPISSHHQVSHTRGPSLHFISYKRPSGSCPLGHRIGQGMCFMTWPQGGDLGTLFPMENLHLGWTRLPSGSPLLLVYFFKHLVATEEGIWGEGGMNWREYLIPLSCLASQGHLQSQSSLPNWNSPPSTLLLAMIVLKDNPALPLKNASCRPRQNYTLRRCNSKWGVRQMLKL